MEKENDNADFDIWWCKNRARLITIYNKQADLSLAVMDIAEAAWEGCAKCQQK